VKKTPAPANTPNAVFRNCLRSFIAASELDAFRGKGRRAKKTKEGSSFSS